MESNESVAFSRVIGFYMKPWDLGDAPSKPSQALPNLFTSIGFAVFSQIRSLYTKHWIWEMNAPNLQIHYKLITTTRVYCFLLDQAVVSKPNGSGRWAMRTFKFNTTTHQTNSICCLLLGPGVLSKPWGLDGALFKPPDASQNLVQFL